MEQSERGNAEKGNNRAKMTVRNYSKLHLKPNLKRHWRHTERARERERERERERARGGKR